jgi:uncharacterized lipoprotein YbaY
MRTVFAMMAVLALSACSDDDAAAPTPATSVTDATVTEAVPAPALTDQPSESKLEQQ